MDQSSHTNRAGVGKTLLLLIAEPSVIEVIAVGSSQTFGCDVVISNNTKSKPPIIQSDCYCYQTGTRISLGSLKIRSEVQRGLLWSSGNDIIRMNLTVIIGGNFPQGTGLVGFNIFDSIRWMLDFSNMTAASWHDSVISDNPVCESIFKNAGREIFLSWKRWAQKF